jgi:hypothetical protein
VGPVLGEPDAPKRPILLAVDCVPETVDLAGALRSALPGTEVAACDLVTDPWTAHSKSPLRPKESRP